MKHMNELDLNTLGKVTGGAILPSGYFDAMAQKEEYEYQKWVEENTTFHTNEDGSGGISTVW